MDNNHFQHLIEAVMAGARLRYRDNNLQYVAREGECERIARAIRTRGVAHVRLEVIPHMETAATSRRPRFIDVTNAYKWRTA